MPSLGVNFALSTGVSADDIEITGAHNKGDGGNGYAIQIRDVYDSSFTNLTDMDMRHSVVFASWRSAAGNFVHVAFTDRDINFHGGRDHDNVVLVDQSIRDANSDIISPTLFVNAEGTSYGSVTDADANTVRFGYVVGSRLGDNIQGYDAGSWLDGQDGNDTLTGGAGNDVLIGGLGSDLLAGGAGEDIAVYADSHLAFAISAEADGLHLQHVAQGDTDILTGIEWILFSDTALRTTDMTLVSRSSVGGVYTGISAYDPVSGTYVTVPGPVLDTSDAGQIVIYGTDGKDIIDVTEPNTIVWGLGGWDVVRSTVDFVMMDDVEKLELLGTGPVNGQGGANDNIITGTEATNILNGMGGNDRIWARAGDDLVIGGDGDDEIYGGGGSDTIIGGLGSDTMTGDSGADIFVFADIADSLVATADWIMDFVTGTDLIDLSGIDADITTAGDQTFTIAGTGAGALWLDTGAIYGDVDGDGSADLAINVALSFLVTDDFIL